MIKAAFFDIDGTLVSFRTHVVPQSAKEALDRLRSRGVKLFISSGRHMSSIDNLGDLRFDGYVTVNGGMTFLGKELIDHNPIDRDDVLAMLSMLYGGNSVPFPVCFVLKDRLVMDFTNAESDELFNMLKFSRIPPRDDLRRFANEDVYQMISFFPPAKDAEMFALMPHCQSARWSDIFTDVVPMGQSKIRGMQSLGRMLGFNLEEVVSFGDGGNDVEMLYNSAIGVAMGNASSEVKRMADWVVPSVDDDGIAWAVERLFADKFI